MTDLATTSRHSLPISETFTSIQGEGSLTGVPSWFMRVSGCNLRCAWCDTPYASWKPEGTTRTLDDLTAEAARVMEGGVTHAVLTGGEPMLFPAIEPLADRLKVLGMHITVETAGTVFRPIAADLMSISPKLSNSTPVPESEVSGSVGVQGTGAVEGLRWGLGVVGVVGGEWAVRHEQRRLNFEVLQGLIDRFPTRQFKFVVADAADVEEIDEVLVNLRGWAPAEIMLMPEGVVTPSRARVEGIARLCVSRGWRYCHRLHIELFGNRRGT